VGHVSIPAGVVVRQLGRIADILFPVSVVQGNKMPFSRGYPVGFDLRLVYCLIDIFKQSSSATALGTGSQLSYLELADLCQLPSENAILSSVLFHSLYFSSNVLTRTLESLVLHRVVIVSCLKAVTASTMNMPLSISSGLCARSSFSECDRIYYISLGSPILDFFIMMSLVSFSVARNWYPPEISSTGAVTVDWVS
jgi:hypothetical protein